VLTLNVDQADHESVTDVREIQAVVARLKLPFQSGIVDGSEVELLETVERSLLLHHAPLPIPTSFLVDEHGRLAVVYKGPLDVEQLLADRQLLDDVSNDPRDAAVPFPGRWLTDPFPPDLLSIPSQLVVVRRGLAAYEYLSKNVLSDRRNPDPWQQLGVTGRKVNSVLQSTASLLLNDGHIEKAIELHRHMIRYEPEEWDLHVRLAALLIGRQLDAEAIEVSQRMTNLRPNHPLPWNNIAWVLATSQDERVRNPKKGVELAERLCEATKFREPSALDTLAVAYAANQQFDDAVATAEKAISRCEALKLDELAQTIRIRLDLYRRGQPISRNSP
jgi:hypothetical protein